MEEKPRSPRAEREVLASILVDPNVLHEVAEVVSTDDFYSRHHQYIYDAMLAVNKRMGTVDHLVLTQELKDRNQWEEIGGIETLSKLLDMIGTSAHAPHYAGIIADKSRRRKIIDSCHDLIAVSADDAAEDADISTAANAVVDKVSGGDRDTSKNTLQAIGDVYESIVARATNPGEGVGIKIGLGGSGKALFGHRKPGDSCILAGRPGMGKTTAAIGQMMMTLDEGINVYDDGEITRRDATVAFVSLETPREQILEHMISAEAGVINRALRDGVVRDWDPIRESISKFGGQSHRFHIIDNYVSTPAQIYRKLLAIKRKFGLDLVVLDYLQLMSHDDKRITGEYDTVTYCSRQFKLMARELDCVFLTLSQLNRELEKRNDKRPILSDLRSSGAVEQDADLVWYLYRHHVYDESFDPSVIEHIAAKNRGGRLGKVQSTCDMARSRMAR